MITYGYEATGDLSHDVFVYVVGKDGKVKNEVRFKAPIVSMMHDIATHPETHRLQYLRFTTNPERMARPARCTGRGIRACRRTSASCRAMATEKDIRWFKGPERAAIHILNATTKGNKVTVEAPVSDGNPFPFFPSRMARRGCRRKP